MAQEPASTSSPVWQGLLLGLLIAALSSCSPDPAALPSSSTGGEMDDAFFSSDTHIVWARALEGGKGDVFCKGSALQLMAFDSSSKEERVLVEGPGSFHRPLFTPAGTSVIYTDLRSGEIRLVPFSGEAAPVTLLEGGWAALDTATDPSGKTVVFAATEFALEKGPLVAREVHRFLLSSPEESLQKVWDQTEVTLDGFQANEDGSRFVAGLPWPDIGLVDPAQGSWRKAGHGCWPSLAPAELDLLWMFEGTHTRVSLLSPEAGKKWTVPLNSHPDLKGHEVYHPRWTTSPRHIVLTGPYRHQSATGYGKVGSGGSEVEVWMGRFSEDFSRLDSWERITTNQAADFMPDVWISDPEKADLKTITQGKPPGNFIDSLVAEGWGMPDLGLVYQWKNRGGKNLAGPSSAPAKLEPRGEARFGPRLQLLLHHGAAEDRGGLPGEAVAAIAGSGELSLELVLQVSQLPRDPAVLLHLGLQDNPACLALGLRKELITLDIQGLAPPAGAPADHGTRVLGSISENQPVHLLVTLANGTMQVFRDGKLAGQADGLSFDFSKWKADLLRLGPGVQGELSHLAIYDRALDENHAIAKAESVRIEREKAQRLPASIKLRAQLAEDTSLPAPEDLGPYRRALVTQRYQLEAPFPPNFPHGEFLVLRWAILDRKPVRGLLTGKGQFSNLVLRPIEAHPETEGEWTAPFEETGLPLFFHAPVR